MYRSVQDDLYRFRVVLLRSDISICEVTEKLVPRGELHLADAASALDHLLCLALGLLFSCFDTSPVLLVSFFRIQAAKGLAVSPTAVLCVEAARGVFDDIGSVRDCRGARGL